MTKARDLGKLVSQGQALADGVVQAVEVTGLASVATTGSYTDLTNKPTIPTVPTLAAVATSGSYNDLTNKPTNLGGGVTSYNDLTNKPNLATVATSGSYSDLTDKPTIPTVPTLATVATTGSYADLTNKPTIPTLPTLAAVATTGSYADLTNKPTIPSGNYTDLTNKPTLFSGSYTDLTNKPTLFSGSYTDLTNKPTLFSGSYADLTNKPTLATVATSGSYVDLSNKPTIVSLKGTAVTYPGDDLAADPTGSQQITITGTGFESTPTVYIGGTIAPSVTFVSATQLTVTTPAKAAGTYDIYIVNPGGATAIMVYGISYSGTPAWTTAAGSLGILDANWTVQLQATGDAPVAYALTSGSTLPNGVTLNTSGLITGSAVSVEQTFNFSVTATDAQLQDTPRSFSVTISLSEPYFKYVAVLLKGDGSSGAQNNTFLDSSTNNFTITRNGNTTQGTFSPYGLGWSNFFDGTGDYLSVPSNAGFQFGTGDFTIECWFYDTGTSDTYPGIISSANGWAAGSTALRFNNTGTGKFGFFHNPTGDPIFYSTNTFSSYQWHHVAVTRSGTSMKMFVNGVQEASATVSASISLDTAGGVYIGSGFDTSSKIKGYISNVRVVKGTAVYTSTFTPSVEPLTAISGTSLLTCQSNRFIDNSANGFAVTKNGDTSVERFNPFGALKTEYSATTIGGSGYFDANADYLTVPGGSHFNFASNDFTIETWVYLYDNTERKYLFGPGTDTSSHYNGFGIEIWGNQLCLWASSVANSWNLIECDTPSNRGNILIPAKAWTHVAVTRTNGNTFKTYINGVLDRTYTASGAISNSGNQQYNVGRAGYLSGTFYFNGLMSNFRVVNGTAVYITNFTPPTAPVTAVTNTQLLLQFTNAGIIDSAMMNNFETVGNAQISTSVVKYGTGSIYIPTPIGSHLLTQATPQTVFGTGDFTIECWYYAISRPDLAPAIISNDTTGSYPTNYWALHDRHVTDGFSATKFSFWAGNINGSGAPILASTTSVSNGVWYYIAVTRSGSTFRLFVNGTLEASTTSSASIDNNIAKRLSIGRTGYGDSGLNGYIDDLRITKGYARYTATFTPPTAALKTK